jgi:hypothetical protein
MAAQCCHRQIFAVKNLQTARTPNLGSGSVCAEKEGPLYQAPPAPLERDGDYTDV